MKLLKYIKIICFILGMHSVILQSNSPDLYLPTAVKQSANVYLLLSDHPLALHPGYNIEALCLTLIELLFLKKSHIFVSDFVWNEFCRYYQENIHAARSAQIQDYDYKDLLPEINFASFRMYHTSSNLLYITSDEHVNNKLFDIQDWKKIDCQPLHLSIEQFNLESFTGHFKIDKNIEWSFFISGHGSRAEKINPKSYVMNLFRSNNHNIDYSFSVGRHKKRPLTDNDEWSDKYSGKQLNYFKADYSDSFMPNFINTNIAGLNARVFKKVFLFLGHTLNTKQIIIISCHTYPQRILELISKEILPYDLICATNKNEFAYKAGAYFISFPDRKNMPRNRQYIYNESSLVKALSETNKEIIKQLLFKETCGTGPAFLPKNSTLVYDLDNYSLLKSD